MQIIVNYGMGVFQGTLNIEVSLTETVSSATARLDGQIRRLP